MKEQTSKFIAAVLSAFMIFGAVGCKESAEKRDATVEVQRPTYDGTIVRAGDTLGFTNKIGFLSSDVMPTGVNEYAPVTVSLTASVYPSDASQVVTWYIVFVNPTSTWASGKTVTDYVELNVVEMQKVDVTCKAPFGEPIKIVCTSAENSAISAECVVDFLQSPTNITLQFGEDLPITFDGMTNVTWETNKNGVGMGGAASVGYDSYDTYTVADTYTWDIDLLDPEYFVTGVEDETWGDNSNQTTDPSYGDDYFELYFEDPSMLGSKTGYYDCAVERVDNITELSFDLNFMETLARLQFNPLMGDPTTVSTYHSAIPDYFEIEEGTLYTLRLRLTCQNTGKVFEKVSLINVTAFTNAAKVQSVSLSSNSVLY